MPTHPLDPISRSENDQVAALLRNHEILRPSVRVAHLRLVEPSKELVFAWKPGSPIYRKVEATLFDNARNTCVKAIVDLNENRIVNTYDIPGVQPLITPDELDECELVVLQSEELKAKLEERFGSDPIAKMTNLMCDMWAVGHYGGEDTRKQRLARVFLFFRDPESLNPYAYPIDGIQPFVDLNTMKIVKIVDSRSNVPLPPPHDARYVAANMREDLREDVQPLEIVQPNGPSFKVEGHHVRWQNWSLVVGFNAKEGLTLHDVRYSNRPILFRASLSDMVVPYGDPSEEHATKNAFDVSDYGIGFCANSLKLGCDCLGEIRYFDAELLTSTGEPWTIDNAVCMHEEDYGVLWKHFDRHTGVSEDGTIQLETKMTGFLSIGSVKPGEFPKHGNLVAPQVYAPNHQHIFNFRLDFAVDGIENTVAQIDVVSDEQSTENSRCNAFRAQSTIFHRESDAMSLVCPEKSRSWTVFNPCKFNGIGMPVAYKLIPGDNTLPLAHGDAWWRKRAHFVDYHLWVTKFDEKQCYCVGEFPNQNPVDEGLPEFVKQNRVIEKEDCVVWYTFAVTHVPRPEDYPVMPVVYGGFSLKPFGFFDRNPAWDVPPQPNRCHTDNEL